jgi:hypothetical protein
MKDKAEQILKKQQKTKTRKNKNKPKLEQNKNKTQSYTITIPRTPGLTPVNCSMQNFAYEALLKSTLVLRYLVPHLFTR